MKEILHPFCSFCWFYRSTSLCNCFLYLQVNIDFYDDKAELDVSDYNPSREWELVSQSAKKNVKYYACCEEPYPDVTFTLKIRRTENFYTHTYIGPTIIISLIIPGIFALPVTGLHRYMLGEWILLNIHHGMRGTSLALLLRQLALKLPLYIHSNFGFGE